MEFKFQGLKFKFQGLEFLSQIMKFILGLQIPDIQRVRNEVNFEPFFVSFEGIAEGMQDVWF